jgi:flagellar operon protein
LNRVDPNLLRPVITGKAPGVQEARPSGQSFKELLGQRISQSDTLKFSKHALSRTEQRGIELTPAEISRLDEAVGRAREKGLNDTLIFMNSTAFIVNARSKTVVTVVDSDETQGTVFTNIDGAVIV